MADEIKTEELKTEEVFCNWVGLSVHPRLLGRNCKTFIKDGKCDQCSRSPQITELGANPMDLLRNMKSCS